MALVSCPECQKEVSTHALACPQCAFPFPGKQARGVGQTATKLYACPDCACPVSKQAQTCPHCGVTLEGEQKSLPTNQSFVEETWLCTHCGTPYTRKVRQEKEVVADPHVVVPTRTTARSVERLLEPVSQQEAAPTSTTAHSMEKLLEPVSQPEAAPTSTTAHSMEKLLEPGSHPEAVPTRTTGQSVERLLEPVSQQEAAPTSTTAHSMEKLLEPGSHPEAVPTRTTGHSAERTLGPVPNQVKRENVSASPRRRSQLWQDSSFGEEIESFLPRYPRSRKKSILMGLLVFILIVASVVGGALWQLQGINPLEILVYWRM
jgi:hypothetical protein